MKLYDKEGKLIKEVSFQLDFGTIKILKKEMGVDYFGNAAKRWKEHQDEIEAAKAEDRQPKLDFELDVDEFTSIMIACTKRAKIVAEKEGRKLGELSIDEIDSLSIPQLVAARFEIESLIQDFAPDKKDEPVKNVKRQS